MYNCTWRTGVDILIERITIYFTSLFYLHMSFILIVSVPYNEGFQGVTIIFFYLWVYDYRHKLISEGITL